MKKTLTMLGGAAMLAALALTGCSAGETAAEPAEPAETTASSRVLTDGVWMSGPIEDDTPGPGVTHHQTKLVVDGTSVKVSEISCDGTETSVAAGYVDGDRLTITEAGETNSIGSTTGQLEVMPLKPGSPDSFQAGIDGYGFVPDEHFLEDVFPHTC